MQLPIAEMKTVQGTPRLAPEVYSDRTLCGVYVTVPEIFAEIAAPDRTSAKAASGKM